MSSFGDHLMQQLGMFAKYWQPGAVKTRLASAIGDRQASRVYHGFLLALVQRLRQVADRRAIVYTPQAHRADFQSLASDDWSLQPQTTGDLGYRMSCFFSAALARNQGPVVLIGSDSPTLPVEYIQHAFDLLREFPVVLGPSQDGGYYLVGVSRQVPPIFTGITWSSCHVWEQTTSLLQNAGCEYAALPSWYDVDDWDGLQKLRAELAENVECDEATRALLRTLLETVRNKCD